VLQCHAGYMRILQVLKVRADRAPPVFEVIKRSLLTAPPATTFDDDTQLLYTRVTQEIRRQLLSGEIPEVVDAELHVSAHCDYFEHDDIDIPTLIDTRDTSWEGADDGELLPTKPDGMPDYTGDQIGTTSHLRAAKSSEVRAHGQHHIAAIPELTEVG
jgi:hypothetical protein